MQSIPPLRTAIRLSVVATRLQLRSYPAPSLTAPRYMCTKSDDNHNANTPKPPNSFLSRLLAASEGGQNPLLSVLGYYSTESRAIGAGNELYKQALRRAETAAAVEAGGSKAFAPRYEMLSVHVYLILRRLRAEKGNEQEAEVKTVMQCLFDVFWTDVRKRMMIEENGMKLIESAKWIKDCEQRFFGMALAFDEAWGNNDEMRESISRNITCLDRDEVRVERFRKYMTKEKRRLDASMLEQIFEGAYKDERYPNMQSV